MYHILKLVSLLIQSTRFGSRLLSLPTLFYRCSPRTVATASSSLVNSISIIPYEKVPEEKYNIFIYRICQGRATNRFQTFGY